MLVLHEKYADLDRIEDLLPVAIEVARFKIMAARRKSVRRGEHNQLQVDDLPLPSKAADPFEETARKEQIERLETALSQLGPRCRDLMRLKLQGLTFAEIQKRMGAATLNTVYTWDFR